ncbi:MAG: hypothetical protein ACFUZC_22660 [Chthoniobacteraceae bacterium]
MKTISLLAAAFAAALTLTGRAQDPTGSGSTTDLLPPGDLFPSIPAPAQPAPEAPEPTTAAPTPAPARPPVPDVPESMKKGTSAQLRQAIRMRQIKTDLLADPVIQAELARARAAKTEEGHRVLMRNYFLLLYTRIEKIDPSLCALAETELRNALLRYEQHNVCPSVLIEPGICPLPGSNSKDHPGAVPPSPTPTPSPSPMPVPRVYSMAAQPASA